jgi:hypothetical protein
MSPDPKNPSVLDARELDAQHKPTSFERVLKNDGDEVAVEPEPRFIVFYRQAANATSKADWVMERTSDGIVMAWGTLEEMLALIGTEKYPHARRATWAEDMLRYKPASFYEEYKHSG